MDGRARRYGFSRVSRQGNGSFGDREELSMWRVYVLSALIACGVAVATTLLTMRLSNFTAAPGPGADPGVKGNNPLQTPTTVVLEGEAEVHLARSREEPAELEVFYKAPFAAPPHLTFPEGLDNGCQVADQKAGGFKLRRIQRDGLIFAKVKWKAEGQPAK
jgi:hypothetical protein